MQLLSVRGYLLFKRAFSPIGAVAVVWFAARMIRGLWTRLVKGVPRTSSVKLPSPYNYSAAYDEVQLWAQRAPLSIRPLGWVWVWGASLLLGSIAYTLAVLSVYFDIQARLVSAQPTEVSFLSVSAADCTSSSNEPSKVGKWYGAAFGISEEKVLRQLGAIVCANLGKNSDLTSSIGIVQAFLQQNQSCGNNCSADCPKYWRRRLARLLGGSFRSGPEELARSPQPSGIVVKSTIQGGAAVSLTQTTEQKEPAARDVAAPIEDGCKLRDSFSPGEFITGSLAKPTPISAPEVAKWLLGTQSCIQDDKDRCLLITRLLQSALDSADVRTARTFVNMIWGWERLAVIVLFFVLLFLLVYRSVVRQNLDVQKKRVLLRFAAISRANQRRTSGRQASLVEASATKEVYKWFVQCFPQDKDNPDFTPIRNLLKVSEAEEIRIRARIDSELITQSRVPLDTLITVFPVIGFVATLWGLITALSSANLIASSTGDARNASVMHVTSELSSCFSTTLLALVFMTAFAVWNTLQAKRELALVGDVQDCLLSGGNFSARYR